MSTSTEHLIDTAKKAANAATDFLVGKYHEIHTEGKHLNVEVKTSQMDLVTEIDRQSQAIIVDVIQQQFPDHRFLAEEEGADTLGDPNCPYQWIIDPLDGTTNFIHGKRNFGSIIAVRNGDDLTAGAMHLPLLDQWFWGGKDAGSYYNGDTVKLRDTGGLAKAVLNCNLIHRAKDIDGTLHVTLPPCRSIENYGCAAEELGEILMGHTDGVFFDGIPQWDIAAGFLLVEEAGGRMAFTLESDSPRSHTAKSAAATDSVFDELWEWVQHQM